MEYGTMSSMRGYPIFVFDAAMLDIEPWSALVSLLK
ncbi:hypothetical protein LINGRAHAP2_LOCUS23237 [Linum grandiflorum]